MKINKKQTIKEKSRIGLLEQISFGLGDFSINSMFFFVGTYLMYYCTDTVRLDMSWVSLILLFGSIANTVMSPVMGILVDRSNFRMGRCRPFVAAGMVPTILLMVVLFSTPGGSPRTGLLITVVYFIFNLGYSFLNVPYSTMITVLTDRNEERVSLNLHKNLSANIGGMLVTAVTLPLVHFFEGKQGNGYQGTAIFFGVIVLAGLIMCVANTHERVRMEKADKGKKIPLWPVISKDRPYILFCCVQFLIMICMGMRNQGAIYYATYYLKDESVSSVILTITSFVCLVVAFALPAIERRTGLRALLMAGESMYIIAMFGTLLSGRNGTAVVAWHVLSSVGWALETGMMFVVASQTIDYAEWKTGHRPQGMMISILALIQKLGNGIAGLVSPQILKLGHYTAGAEASASTIAAMKWLFCGLPLILTACAMLFMFFYRLDRIYPRVAADLQKRHAE